MPVVGTLQTISVFQCTSCAQGKSDASSDGSNMLSSVLRSGTDGFGAMLLCNRCLLYDLKFCFAL